jgi:hypothetical protein
MFVGVASQNDSPRTNDQHDITAGTKRQAVSSRSTIIMPSQSRQHGNLDGMAISTPDVNEGIDVVGETSPPIHFRQQASTEANSLRRREDVPTDHFATQDVNRNERCRRKDDCPTESFATQGANRRSRFDRKNDGPTEASQSHIRPRTNRQPGSPDERPASRGRRS